MHQILKAKFSYFQFSFSRKLMNIRKYRFNIFFIVFFYNFLKQIYPIQKFWKCQKILSEKFLKPYQGPTQTVKFDEAMTLNLTLSNDYSVFNWHCAYKRKSYMIHSHALMILFWINLRHKKVNKLQTHKRRISNDFLQSGTILLDVLSAPSLT